MPALPDSVMAGRFLHPHGKGRPTTGIAPPAPPGPPAPTVRTAHTLDAVQFCVGSIETVSADVRVATPFPAIGDTGRLVERTAPDPVLIPGRLSGGGAGAGRVLRG